MPRILLIRFSTSMGLSSVHLWTALAGSRDTCCLAKEWWAAPDRPSAWGPGGPRTVTNIVQHTLHVVSCRLTIASEGMVGRGKACRQVCAKHVLGGAVPSMQHMVLHGTCGWVDGWPRPPDGLLHTCRSGDSSLSVKPSLSPLLDSPLPYPVCPCAAAGPAHLFRETGSRPTRSYLLASLRARQRVASGGTSVVVGVLPVPFHDTKGSTLYKLALGNTSLHAEITLLLLRARPQLYLCSEKKERFPLRWPASGAAAKGHRISWSIGGCYPSGTGTFPIAVQWLG